MGEKAWGMNGREGIGKEWRRRNGEGREEEEREGKRVEKSLMLLPVFFFHAYLISVCNLQAGSQILWTCKKTAMT